MPGRYEAKDIALVTHRKTFHHDTDAPQAAGSPLHPFPPTTILAQQHLHQTGQHDSSSASSTARDAAIAAAGAKRVGHYTYGKTRAGIASRFQEREGQIFLPQAESAGMTQFGAQGLHSPNEDRGMYRPKHLPSKTLDPASLAAAPAAGARPRSMKDKASADDVRAYMSPWNVVGETSPVAEHKLVSRYQGQGVNQGWFN